MRHVLDYLNPHAPSARSRRRWLAAFGALMLAALIGYTLLAPSINWSGGVLTDVDVHVFDAISGKPVSGAIIVALDANGGPSRFSGSGPIATDSAGNARVTIFVSAGGKRTWGYDRYGYGESSHLIQVTATGYLPAMAAPGNARGMKMVGIKWQPRLAASVGLQSTPSTKPDQD